MAGQETTSALETRLRDDIREAQRAHDQLRIDALRLALNAFHLEEVARTDKNHKAFRQPLTETDRIALLDKQIKQREEAAVLYRQAGRTELVEKETREAELLRAYMPAKMTDDEVRTIVGGLIAQHGKVFNVVIKLAQQETKGRAEGKRVAEIVREMVS
jgi:uncharacterized protein